MQDPNSNQFQDSAVAQESRIETAAGAETTSTKQSHAFPGLKIARRFTEPGEDVWATVEWEKRSAIITGEKGDIVFEQHDIDVPKGWTQLATNVVASKYFRGHIGTPERETSVKQLIQRISYTMADWGKAMGYFATEADYMAFRDELTHLLLHQKAAFNSPVWFNVGLKDQPRPQCSACFINSVQDTMDSILRLARTEGMLFKFGSGTGTNLSPLRSSKEKLFGGGTASGPVSFMKGYDAFAGVIKSGGKTRRAAKMVILNADHPDIMQFITCKSDEEKKAWALIDAGFNGNFNVPGGAYDSISYQNANHSVRVTDEFMEAYLKHGEWQTRNVSDGSVANSYKADDVMKAIAGSAWICGDPGMQFDTTINKWHTCKVTDRIHASNPCVTGDTLVATSEGYQRMDSLVGKAAQVIGADGFPHLVTDVFPTGTKQVFRLRTRSGFEVRITGNHKVLTTSRGDVPVSDLVIGDRLMLQGAGFGRRTLSDGLGFSIGAAVGDGCLSRSVASGNMQEIITLVMAEDELPVLEKVAVEVGALKQALRAPGSIGNPAAVRVSTRHTGVSRLSFSSQPVVALFKEFSTLDEGSDRKRFTPSVFDLDRPSLAAVLRGLFTTDGTVANYGEKSQYIALDSTSEELLQQVQLLLLSFGIKAKIYRERRAGSSQSDLPDGRGGTKSYPVKEMHSLRISRSSRFIFAREIGFDAESPKADALAALNAEVGAYQDSLTDEVAEIVPLGMEPVYDLTENATHHFVANGIVVHNCSEYMFLNDSACNLASLNLMKFRREDGEFDVEAYKHGCRILITAQEIIVDNASYPTELIAKNSHAYRPLGLGYANLGALLMSRGIAYDSDAGRALAGALTAIMTGEAYHQSAIVARDHVLPVMNDDDFEAAAQARGRSSTNERPYYDHGAFPGHPPNAESMLDVMRMHRSAVDQIDDRYVPHNIIEAAKKCWDDAIALGEKHGYRNAQATVLAPTGTIGFMMDCDTTGVEPDIAIVKYKSLVGGGLMKIVNNTVPEALSRLGYSAEQVKEIISYIDQHDTIEGAPELKDEHLSVFDCAFKPANGERSIHYMGHVKMMAATQPFISGAISKTVNMPTDTTPEEIMQSYVESWRLGVKAIAIYRDGSKRTQPLSTKRGDGETEGHGDAVTIAGTSGLIASGTVRKPVRRKLPDERQSITHKFSIAGHEGYITVGMYEDGSPGEIFLTMSKEGSTISGLMDTIATMTSLALQYGVPLETLVTKFAHTRFEPSGYTPNADIRFAKSIPDYIFRWLGTKFLPKDEQPEEEQGMNGEAGTETADGEHTKKPHAAGDSPRAKSGAKASGRATGAPASPSRTVTDHERQIFELQADAPACADCGALMVRNGACYKCLNCGGTQGCS